MQPYLFWQFLFVWTLLIGCSRFEEKDNNRIPNENSEFDRPVPKELRIEAKITSKPNYKIKKVGEKKAILSSRGVQIEFEKEVSYWLNYLILPSSQKIEVKQFQSPLCEWTLLDFSFENKISQFQVWGWQEDNSCRGLIEIMNQTGVEINYLNVPLKGSAQLIEKINLQLTGFRE